MKPSAIHSGFMSHRRFLYAWLAVLLAVLVAAGLQFRTGIPHETADLLAGYGLGGLALALMIWLAWFGVRKRSYRGGSGLLKAWLSAHVWFGLALLALVAMHAGTRLDTSLHGFAYLLVVITVATGLLGVAFYWRFPRRVAANREGLTFDDMVLRIAEIDLELRALAPRLGERENAIVRRADEDARLGGGPLLLLVRPRNRAAAARRALARLGTDGEAVSRAEALLASKAGLVDRIQRDIQLRSRLRAWLLLHVPLSLAALAAVLAHAVAMLVYV